MVSIRSPLVVSCLTSIVFNIVSLTAFEIFDVKVLWPRSRMVQGQRWWRQSTAYGWLPIWLLATPASYHFLKYLTCNFNDLELGQFKIGDFLFDFYWPHHRICHQFWNISHDIVMTLNQHSSRSSKVKDDGANWQHMGDFLFDLYWPHHHICHNFF